MNVRSSRTRFYAANDSPEGRSHENRGAAIMAHTYVTPALHHSG
jgi:hypothetical protein